MSGGRGGRGKGASLGEMIMNLRLPGVVCLFSGKNERKRAAGNCRGKNKPVRALEKQRPDGPLPSAHCKRGCQRKNHRKLSRGNNCFFNGEGRERKGPSFLRQEEGSEMGGS